MAVPLLSVVAPPRRLIADKAYDADSLRRWLKVRRIKAVIPSTATRTVPYPLDHTAYRRRISLTASSVA
jgi:IS5 family transposase